MQPQAPWENGHLPKLSIHGSGHHNSPAPPNTATSSGQVPPPPPPLPHTPSLRHIQGSRAQASVGGRRDGAAAHAGLQLRGARHHCASGPRRGLRQLRLRRRAVPAEAPFQQQSLQLQLRRAHIQLPRP
jgi:hypothetical protein